MKTRLSTIVWGLALIVLGVAFAGNALELWHFSLFFDGWWTLFIIIPCGVSLIQNGLRTGPIVGVLFGVFLLLSEQDFLPFELGWKLLVPVILVAAGVSVLLGNRKFQPRSFRTVENPNPGGPFGFTAVFGGREERVTGTFEGCEMTGVFGAVSLDLRDAVISHDVTVNITAVFGGAELRVPRNVHVRLSSTPILGGVENKVEDTAPVGAPTMYVSAVCAFGGVEIK